MTWKPMENGTEVRHRQDSYVGVIDGLTEICKGPKRNPGWAVHPEITQMLKTVQSRPSKIFFVGRCPFSFIQRPLLGLKPLVYLLSAS